SLVKILRYKDVELGPRCFPSAETFEKILVPIDMEGKLLVDFESKTISLMENGQSISLGNRIIYQI
ncbi:hypothetical protein BLA29_014992, partial [Euroglyphus maynei]